MSQIVRAMIMYFSTSFLFLYCFLNYTEWFPFYTSLLVDDLAKSVSHAKDALEKCIELANKLNGYLQEGERLDIFRMEIPNSSTPSTSQSELDSELSSHVASL